MCIKFNNFLLPSFVFYGTVDTFVGTVSGLFRFSLKVFSKQYNMSKQYYSLLRMKIFYPQYTSKKHNTRNPQYTSTDTAVSCAAMRFSFLTETDYNMKLSYERAHDKWS